MFCFLEAQVTWKSVRIQHARPEHARRGLKERQRRSNHGHAKTFRPGPKKRPVFILLHDTTTSSRSPSPPPTCPWNRFGRIVAIPGRQS